MLIRIEEMLVQCILLDADSIFSDGHPIFQPLQPLAFGLKFSSSMDNAIHLSFHFPLGQPLLPLPFLPTSLHLSFHLRIDSFFLLLNSILLKIDFILFQQSFIYLFLLLLN